MTIVALLVGIAVGGAAAWLVFRARADAALAAARAEAEVERRAAEKAREELKAVSAEALRENQSAFLALAETKMIPLKESLEKVDGQVRSLEQARQLAFGALRQELGSLREGQERLRNETGNLVTALRAPHVRGRWGEAQLRRVVEHSGMLPHCDFVTQASVRDGDGALLRPDLIVKLPGGKSVVVDAKAPLAAYLDAFEAQDEDVRRERLEAHARQVREHMTKLAAKAYWRQFAPTPEFVIMFLPDEVFLRAALEFDAPLFEDSWRSQVILASPTNFLTLLRTIACGWQQETVAESAREVHKLGQELYDRLGTMAGHVHKLGQSIKGAVCHYNNAVGALESRVLVTGRRLQQHGISGDELPQLDPVELQPRALAAEELVGDLDAA